MKVPQFLREGDETVQQSLRLLDMRSRSACYKKPTKNEKAEEKRKQSERPNRKAKKKKERQSSVVQEVAKGGVVCLQRIGDCCAHTHTHIYTHTKYRAPAHTAVKENARKKADHVQQKKNRRRCEKEKQVKERCPTTHTATTIPAESHGAKSDSKREGYTQGQCHSKDATTTEEQSCTETGRGGETGAKREGVPQEYSTFGSAPRKVCPAHTHAPRRQQPRKRSSARAQKRAQARAIKSIEERRGDLKKSQRRRLSKKKTR